MADSGEIEECELDQPLWAVVNSRGVVKGELGHATAHRMAKDIDSPSVCVVLQGVAERLGKKIA